MTNYKDRLQTAQWILERNLAWIAAAEVKVGVIVAIDIAMLGGLGAAFSEADAVSAWGYVYAFLAAATLAGGLICAAMTVIPRVTGPKESMVFFGGIAKLDGVSYVDRLRQMTDTQLLEDWAAQIHRNAEIARDKFGWVRAGMLWSFISVLPWFGAIFELVKK